MLVEKWSAPGEMFDPPDRQTPPWTRLREFIAFSRDSFKDAGAEPTITREYASEQYRSGSGFSGKWGIDNGSCETLDRGPVAPGLFWLN